VLPHHGHLWPVTAPGVLRSILDGFTGGLAERVN
jgi:hypothetical protein